MKNKKLLNRIVEFLNAVPNNLFGDNYALVLELEAYIACLKQEKEEVIHLLKTLKSDAEMALDGEWDKSDDGFGCQIDAIEEMLTKLKEKK